MRQMFKAASVGDQDGIIDSGQIFPANLALCGFRMFQIPLHELHVMSMYFGCFMVYFLEVDHDSLVALIVFTN